MWIANDWKDYRVIDAEGGEKLEQWGKYVLVRPDPQVIWSGRREDSRWRKPSGRYIRSSKGGGEWEGRGLPEEWSIGYREMEFKLKPFAFKHTGLFPEQAVNWDWMGDKIEKAGRPVKILNLFAYTGGATIACALRGAHVTHVDASKGMVGWAKENARISKVPEDHLRWIVDDCRKFAEREIRRGNTYDAIIMDPPSYGRGPKGEIWKLEESVFPFLVLTEKLLSDKPLFVLLNSYTTGIQPCVLTYMLSLVFGKRPGAEVVSEEIGLPVMNTGLILPCGASGRVEF